MSQLVFPTLAGTDIAIKRTPVWATKIQTSSAGKEQRASFQSTPRWRYEIPLNFARIPGFSVNTTTDEMAAILGLFNAVRGRWDSFLYADPYSNAALLTSFGTGDAADSTFQLLDIEGLPVFDLNGAPAIYKTDWQGAQLQYLTARTNMSTQSQTFNTTWTQTNSSVTADSTVAPDGTTTADTITDTASNTQHYLAGPVTATVISTVYTSSVWLKAGTKTTAWIGLSGATVASVDVNLAAGTITRVGVNVTASSIVAYPGGWFRVTVTAPAPTGSDRLYVGLGVQTATYVGSSQTVFAWGAQVELGSVPTSYIPTTTAAVTVTDYTLSGTGLVTFAVNPVSGAVMTWTGSYYRRVRFDMDEYEQEQMFNKCWDGGVLKLLSVK